MRDLPFLPARFETRKTAENRRTRLVGQLMRSATRGAHELAAVLASCRARHRCGSGACPVCQRRWRIAILREADRVLPREGLLRISWVPVGGIIPPGELPDINLRRFLASRRRALERTFPGALVFGGIDVSHNTTKNDAGVWQVHIYLVVVAANRADMRRNFRKRCPGEPTAPRPYMIGPVRDRAKVLSYVVKAMMYRRSRYIDKKTGRWNTASQSLSVARAVEAALFQHRWPPEQRLLLCGLRLFRGIDGWRLHRLGVGPVVERRHRELAERHERARERIREPLRGRFARRKGRLVR